MQDKDTTKSTLFQVFYPIIANPQYHQLLEQLEADLYVKKMSTTQLIELLAIAQLKQFPSLRDISNSLHDDQFNQEIALDSISASQISRRLRELSPEICRMLFNAIKLQIGMTIGFGTLTANVNQLYIIDASTISLCLSRYPWAVFRKTKSGIKLHLRLKFTKEGAVPDDVIFTPAKQADKTQMDSLVVEETDALNVFDRGYVDYKKFDSYCEKGIRFVTRLKGNAVIEVVKESPIPQGIPITKDCIVYLGKEGTTKMQHPLRLLETTDANGKRFIITTNDFELSAEELGDIYRYRWQIELFFKWIKQHCHVKHFYGLSFTAVENQLLIALIAYCLLLLLKLKNGYQGSLLNIKRIVCSCLCELFNSFLEKLLRRPKHRSRGRQKINHEAMYQKVLLEVMNGNPDYLMV